MKRFFRLLCACTFLSLSFAASISAAPNLPTIDISKVDEVEKRNQKKKEKLELLVFLQSQSYEDLMAMKTKDVEEQLGRKLGLKEKMMVHQAIHQAKKHDRKVKKGKAAPQAFTFHVGGFVLGLLLGLIGVLIALVFEDRRNAVLSALIGFAILAVVLGVSLAI